MVTIRNLSLITASLLMLTAHSTYTMERDKIIEECDKIFAAWISLDKYASVEEFIADDRKTIEQIVKHARCVAEDAEAFNRAIKLLYETYVPKIHEILQEVEKYKKGEQTRIATLADIAQVEGNLDELSVKVKEAVVGAGRALERLCDEPDVDMIALRKYDNPMVHVMRDIFLGVNRNRQYKALP